MSWPSRNFSKKNLTASKQNWKDCMKKYLKTLIKKFEDSYNKEMVVSKDDSDIYGYCCPYLAEIIQNSIDKIEESKISKPNFKHEIKDLHIYTCFVDPWRSYHKNKLYCLNINGNIYSEREVNQHSIDALYSLSKKLFLKSFTWKIKDANLNQMLAIYQLFSKWQKYIGDRKVIRLEKDGIRLVYSQNKKRPIVYIDEQLMKIEKESMDVKELNNNVHQLLNEKFKEIANDASIKKTYKKVKRMWEISIENWLPDEKPNQDTSKIGHF
jgi:hypothetical protein